MNNLFDNSFRYQLLLVDDSAMNLDTLLATLGNNNDIRVAIDGKTALGSDEDEARGLELGAVDYISKPFNPAIVCHRIKTHLELKHHQDNLQTLGSSKNHELTKTYKDLKQVHDQMLQQEKMA